MSAELWFAIVSLGLGFIGACFSALASIIAFLVKRGEDAQDRAIEELKDCHDTMEIDISNIKQLLVKYETHIGAGDQRIREIKDGIADHVMKEEQIFWKKVDAVSEAHRLFAETVLQRLTSMEARLPNGELKELVISMAEVKKELELVKLAANQATDHVIKHDAEAEDWKRRIVALEAMRGRSSVKK